MLSLHDKRQSGIASIGDLPWGSHFCQFYQTAGDLLEVLIPYFRAGLENNEYCVWVTSKILGAGEVEKALRKAVPHFEKYAGDQLEIIPYSRWRARGGKSGSAVLSKLDQAVTSGFAGLRLACNVIPEDGSGEAVSCRCPDPISRNNVIAVFMYPRDRFDTLGLMEAVKHHRFALIRNAGGWEVIESSEARTTKDALKRTEEKLESLFRNMSEGFAYHRIVLDSGRRPCDYIFLEVNQAFESLTGLKGKKIIGRRVTEILPGIEKDPTDWIGKYSRVALTGKPVNFESYSEALKKWYSVSAFCPQKGYFATTFSDITQRKQDEAELRRQRDELDEYKAHLEQMVETRTADLLKANLRLLQEIDERLGVEEQLRASERRLKEAEKIAHLGHWELDLGSNALFWSDEVYRIFGLDPGEFDASYEAFLDIVHPEDREFVNHSFADSVETRTPYDIVHRLRMKDGSVKFVNEKCLTDYDEAGKPRRSMGTVLDITPRKLAEEELKKHREHLEELVRERTAELERANKELQNFAFIASHDLQEPLRKVIAFGDRLRAKYAAVLDERGQDYLLRMENAAERMRELINDLLELSRVTTKAMPFTQTDLESVAHSVLSDLEELLTRTGGKVGIGSLPTLEADKIQIRQLFLNLLTNALKFHDEGASPLVSIESRTVDDFCELAVRDNGIGFDEKYLDRIFRPFQRLHGRGVFRGSGMGLSICKKIVERHGGEITARSAPGEGATFFIKLPLKQNGATHG